MKTRRLIPLLLALAMILAFCSCSGCSKEEAASSVAETSKDAGAYLRPVTDKALSFGEFREAAEGDFEGAVFVGVNEHKLGKKTALH